MRTDAEVTATAERTADREAIHRLGIRTIEADEDGGPLGNPEWQEWIERTVAAANGHPITGGERVAIQMAVLLDRKVRANDADVTAAAEVLGRAMLDLRSLLARGLSGAEWSRTCGRHLAAALRAANLLADPRLTAERDRARDIAVALEGQVARVEALAEEWERTTVRARPAFLVAADEIRAALDPDPADRGTGRDGRGS